MDHQQTTDGSSGVTPPPSPSSPTSPGEPQTIKSWVNANLPVLLITLMALGAFLYFNRTDPLGQLWTWTQVLVGLGFIIFIHELGHFAVAKWCDVHVETFSIGFGPPLPGCCFRNGETLYKIALIPLGGYVKMVGEGTEEEDEDDPRSFKNKSVGQRMAIISAGVIMNLILACVCFSAAYGHGVERTATVIGSVEINSPAWKKGLRTGETIIHIGGSDHPYFEDLKFEVMTSREGKPLRLITQSPDGHTRELSIVPRKEGTDPNPVIGVTFTPELKLGLKEDAKERNRPVLYDSPAARARQLDLQPGDLILATTDPAHPDQMLDLPLADNGKLPNYAELSDRVNKLADESMTFMVLRKAGQKEKLEISSDAFQFEDSIVATTDDDFKSRSYDPFVVKDLPVDPRDPDGKNLDYFELKKRLRNLAGKPVVIKVRRATTKETVSVFVPPAYHYNLPGAFMEMGAVAGVRDESPAEKAGVQANDLIKEIELAELGGKDEDRMRFVVSPTPGGMADKAVTVVRDPLRLPFELRQWVKGRSHVVATVTVYRQNLENHKDRDVQKLPGVDWDFSWQNDMEFSLGLAAPVAIQELGIAYQVKGTVAFVDEKSPAYKAGLRKDDEVLEVAMKVPGKKNEPAHWSKQSFELWTKSKSMPDEKQAEPRWAGVFYDLQLYGDYKSLKLLVRRANEKDQEIEIDWQPDSTWPLADRGFGLDLGRLPQQRLQKADGFANACGMGMTYTYQMVINMYLQLRSMFSGRVSLNNVAGPIGLATIAHKVAGRDIWTFILFLGLINVNLAVVNFLPVPVLDGGHMVFLIYEKLRGKPASERVREITTWVGVALIITLIVTTVFVDVKRIIMMW